MIPETFDFIAELTAQAHALEIEVLVEIHGHYQDQIKSPSRSTGFTISLCRLWCCTLCTRARAARLKHWLSISPRNCSHRARHARRNRRHRCRAGSRKSQELLPGLLIAEEIDNLVETIHARSNGESRQATGAAANNLDLYQVNCTYYDALGRRDEEYLIARALQFFAPGMPQVYYVGLLAGANDLDLLRRTGVGRDINRHYYQPAKIDSELTRPVVRDALRFDPVPQHASRIRGRVSSAAQRGPRDL